jgi:nucleoside-diphosphate-sugar epimerase
MINLYGSSGFIGSNFLKLYKNFCIENKRNDNVPKANQILYFISTVDNYNIYSDPYLDINTNLIKLIEVLEECKKYNLKEKITFNFISSWFVYGQTLDLPANENSICNPTGFYSITKRTAEQLLISYCKTFNINYRILRLTNIIGNDDDKISRKKNAIQYMINCLKNDQDVHLYDGGEHIRDYMYVTDACKAIKNVIDNGKLNEIYNISNSEPVKIKDIIYYVKDKIKSNSTINSIESPKFHNLVQIKDMWLDNTKLISCGYKKEYSIFQALNEIIK